MDVSIDTVLVWFAFAAIGYALLTYIVYRYASAYREDQGNPVITNDLLNISTAATLFLSGIIILTSKYIIAA